MTRVKNNSDFLRFCIATLSHWLKNLTPFCRPIRGNTEANRDRSETFPALRAVCLYVYRVSIGSLDYEFSVIGQSDFFELDFATHYDRVFY